MFEYLAVFIGGGVGSVARFAISGWALNHQGSFPLGTLLSNILSCLLLGFIVGLIQSKNQSNAVVTTFFTVGFCGGFSTFSTFTSETLHLMRAGLFLEMGGNILGNLLLCAGGVFAGFYISKYF